MNIAVFQHTPGETLGFFETFFAERNIPYEYIHLYETNEIPEHEASRFIFLGGPMGVNDDAEIPVPERRKGGYPKSGQRKKTGSWHLSWRTADRLSIRRKGVQICPGNRLYQIRCEPAAESVFPLFPDRFFAFQLHGDTFEIPSGGRLLCSGDPVKNQAFVLESALGMQFHPEITEEILHDWSRDFSQSQRERVLHETPGYIPESNRLCNRIAEYFIRHEPG